MHWQRLRRHTRTHALALAGRRILSRTDSDGGPSSKTGKSVRANLSHTLPTVAAAAVATATPSAGAAASIFNRMPRARDRASRPGAVRVRPELRRRPGAAEGMFYVEGW